MPRGKREAGASPPAAATAELTFVELIEAVTMRYEALAERAAANPKIAAEVRRYGRDIFVKLRSFSRLEHLLDILQTSTDAIAKFGHEGSATAPAPVRTQPIRRISSIQVQLRLLRARVKGDDALEAEKQAIQRESGIGPRKIGALLAHTNGGLKAAWARRALRSVSGDERKQLAEELSGYGYGPVAQLLRGVGR
ncbi:MAG: hypothetical protein Q8R16_04790 [bacterium]|nr:hypothetical protein [bacterium]